MGTGQTIGTVHTDEVVVFNGLVLASTFVELGDEQVKNGRRDGESQTQKRLSQLIGIDLPTPIPVKSLKYALRKLVTT